MHHLLQIANVNYCHSLRKRPRGGEGVEGVGVKGRVGALATSIPQSYQHCYISFDQTPPALGRPVIAADTQLTALGGVTDPENGRWSVCSGKIKHTETKGACAQLPLCRLIGLILPSSSSSSPSFLLSALPAQSSDGG